MITPGRLLLPSICTLLLLAGSVVPSHASGEYRTVEVESLRVTFDSEWAPRTSPGYVPVRLEIVNLGDARAIQIVGRGMRFFRGSRTGGSTTVQFGVSRSVQLARGGRVRLTIPIPVYADNESIGFELHEDGRLLERFSYHGFQSGSRPEHASALIVADTQNASGKLMESWVRKMTGPGAVLTGRVTVSPGSGSVPTMPLDFLLSPERLPDNWLGFTSLRAVVIGPAEWNELSEVQKTALLTWAACGGDLFFVDGTLSALLPAGQRPAASAEPVHGYFFGRIHTPPSVSVSAAGLEDVLTKAWTLQDPNWALPANRASDWGLIAERGFRLPIPGVKGIPARAYLIILIVFSALIGPANYWILREMRQQVLMVVTTPLISALFILLLGAYVLAGEGFGVRGRAMTFTMLDEVRKQAATRASVSLYAAGTSPWGGLNFARDEAVFPIGTDGTGSRESVFMDLNESQRFASGVIDARSPANVEVIGVRPARERLSFDNSGRAIAVVNGLGGTIRALSYRRGSDMYHLTEPLLPGHRGMLKPGPLRTADVIPADLPLASRFEHLFNNQPDGSYFAVLDRSPFWSPGVAAIDERGSFHLVLGWIGGQP